MKKQEEINLPTEWGEFRMAAYAKTPAELMPHFAMVHKEADLSQPIYLRIHSECLTGDLLSSRKCDCHEQFVMSMNLISMEKGVLIYLRQEGRGIGLINKMKAYNLQEKGMDTINANLHLGFKSDEREYSAAIAIMEDLKIDRVHLITNNPAKIEYIKESSIELVSRIPIVTASNDFNERYMQTKREFMGHLID